MKQILTTLFLILSLGTIKAQDIVVIKHTNYTTHYSKSLHYPILVEWWETKANCGCASPIARKDNFQPDPQLVSETSLQKDYDAINKQHKAKGLKGVDRGHMCPARVNECQGTVVENECFYFSNMAPQYHSCNAGDWKSLETLTYTTAALQDSIHVWAGSIGSLEKVGTVTIPKQCWKVIYIKKTKQMKAYLFNNNSSKPDGIIDNEVSVTFISKITGFKFN